jgi:hypothetical protein
MDFEQTVKETMDELASNGFIKKTIKDQLEKTIKESVSNVIRSYGDFGKALDAKLVEALGVDFKSLELPNYNQLVSNWVRDIVDATLIAQGKDQMQKNLADFFKPLEKTEWKITEIVEAFRKSVLEEDMSNADENITFIIERERSFTHFYFDEESGKEKYRCKHRVGLHEGHIFTVNVDGIEGKNVKFDNFYGFESFLFKLYAAKATIIDDGDDVDTYMGGVD